MYRIEVKPGEETIFRTIEELATGIRNGFVTPRARIYHAASQKWLPIEFHPHYKKALEGDFTPAPPTPQPSLAAMRPPTFAFPSAAPAPAPAQVPAAGATPVITAPLPERAPSPAPAKAPPSAKMAAESPVLAMQAAVRHTHSDIADADAEGPVERYSPAPVVEPWRRTAAAEPARPLVMLESPQPEEIGETAGGVAVLEAPRLAPAPEVVLPNITYPEVPPVEPELRATARRSRRSAGRPLLLIGSAAALVLGGQRYLASRSAPAANAPVMEASAPQPVQPKPRPAEKAGSQDKRVSAGAPPAVTRPAQAALQQPAPVAPAPTQRMQPGPAFSASVPARSAETPAGPPAAPNIMPPAPTAEQPPRADAAIAPAPTGIELDVPTALPGDSVVPTVDLGQDSLALKRILKAVTGRKANPTAP